MKSTIELRQLELALSLGTYGPKDVVPDSHLLDLTLTIDPKLVLINVDSMKNVFDYDPLIIEIERLAKDVHYHTQEGLITRIVQACAAYETIKSVELLLSKKPVSRNSGELGVRLQLDSSELGNVRKTINQ